MPQHPKVWQHGLFPLQSPLLRESLLVSFPPLSNMLKFSGSSCLIGDQSGIESIFVASSHIPIKDQSEARTIVYIWFQLTPTLVGCKPVNLFSRHSRYISRRFWCSNCFLSNAGDLVGWSCGGLPSFHAKRRSRPLHITRLPHPHSFSLAATQTRHRTPKPEVLITAGLLFEGRLR